MTFGLADTRRLRRFTVSKASAPTPPIALGPVRGAQALQERFPRETLRKDLTQPLFMSDKPAPTYPTR